MPTAGLFESLGSKYSIRLITQLNYYLVKSADLALALR